MIRGKSHPIALAALLALSIGLLSVTKVWNESAVEVVYVNRKLGGYPMAILLFCFLTQPLPYSLSTNS